MTCVLARWSRVWGVALIGLFALAGGAPAEAHGTTRTAVPQIAPGYEYKVVPWGEGDINDVEGWSAGSAAFGTTNGVCPWNSSSLVKTTWPVGTDLVRKAFTLPMGAHNVVIRGMVDNDATVYLNGVVVTAVTSGFCATNNINVVVPDSVLIQGGTNILAARGHDQGGTEGAATYLDLRVTYDEMPAPSYGVCALYDQSKAHKAGATVPIKLQLCDASGSNLSSGAIVVNAAGLTKLDGTASALVETPGHANPDADFRYDEDLGGYVFNLSTGGLSSGTWQLNFTVDGVADPSYYVRFDVR